MSKIKTVVRECNLDSRWTRYKFKQLDSQRNCSSQQRKNRFSLFISFLYSKIYLKKSSNNGFLRICPHTYTYHILKEAEDTLLGRIVTTRKNNQKMKVSSEEVEDCNTKQEEKNNIFIAKVIELDETVWSDQTWRFPCVSSRGNKCIMLVHCYDTNATLIWPIKNRTVNELTSTL